MCNSLDAFEEGLFKSVLRVFVHFTPLQWPRPCGTFLSTFGDTCGWRDLEIQGKKINLKSYFCVGGEMISMCSEQATKICWITIKAMPSGTMKQSSSFYQAVSSF